MPIVAITAWSKGFQSGQCVQLLHSFAGLSVAEAQRTTENILNGTTQDVAVRSASDARLLVSALDKLGAAAHVRAEE